MSKDGSPETWLSGRLYHSYQECALTLEQLHDLDYSNEYYIPNAHCGDATFSHYADIDYAAVKGYRIFRQGERLTQLFDDFGGNDFIEMNAFLSTLFKAFIGPEEVKRWSEYSSFADDYGVNDLVMSKFTIESDEHEGIFYHTSLTDDLIDWKGFKEHT